MQNRGTGSGGGLFAKQGAFPCYTPEWQGKAEQHSWEKTARRPCIGYEYRFSVKSSFFLMGKAIFQTPLVLTI